MGMYKTHYLKPISYFYRVKSMNPVRLELGPHRVSVRETFPSVEVFSERSRRERSKNAVVGVRGKVSFFLCPVLFFRKKEKRKKIDGVKVMGYKKKIDGVKMTG